MTAGPWMAKLRALAATHSMTIEQQTATRRLIAVRVGPGFPRRLIARATADTPAGWDKAAHLLHDDLKAHAVPDSL